MLQGSGASHDDSVAEGMQEQANVSNGYRKLSPMLLINVGIAANTASHACLQSAAHHDLRFALCLSHASNSRIPQSLYQSGLDDSPRNKVAHFLATHTCCGELFVSLALTHSFTWAEDWIMRTNL